MLYAAVFLIPLVYTSTGMDAFRYPKELLFRAFAIVLLAFFVTAAIWKQFGWRDVVRNRRVGIVVALIALWALIATALSTHHLLSLRALEYTAEALLFFGAAWIAVEGQRPDELLVPAFAAGMLNSLFAISQASGIWNPFRFDPKLRTAHVQTSGFLGNPNDVGAYLLVLLIPATVLAIARKQWRWRIVTAVLVAGLIASQALTAVIAYAAALLVIAFIASRRAGWTIVVASLLATIVAFAVVPPLRARILTIRSAVQKGKWDVATSQRIFPFEAAWDMFKDHPLTGVGPGAFKFHFLDYRMKLNERSPRWFYLSAQNFAEVHNDYLQQLAECGIPALLLFIAALALIANSSRSSGVDDDRSTFTHYGGLATTVGFGVLSLASFPLEMVAVLVTMLYLSAMLLNWSTRS